MGHLVTVNIVKVAEQDDPLKILRKGSVKDTSSSTRDVVLTILPQKIAWIKGNLSPFRNG